MLYQSILLLIITGMFCSSTNEEQGIDSIPQLSSSFEHLQSDTHVSWKRLNETVMESHLNKKTRKDNRHIYHLLSLL